jgi:hypothetical protein
MMFVDFHHKLVGPSAFSLDGPAGIDGPSRCRGPGQNRAVCGGHRLHKLSEESRFKSLQQMGAGFDVCGGIQGKF